MPESLTKKQKLLKLRKYINLETGEIHESAFTETWRLYREAKSLKRAELNIWHTGKLGEKMRELGWRIEDCRKCPGLNMPAVTEACPGWGSLDARIFLIGQSLHSPGVETGIPFILGSGLLIDAALILANIPRSDCFFTNAVHCHPLKNRQSTDGEKRNCLPYLRQELQLVQPDFVVAFGNDAQQSLDIILAQASMRGFKCKTLKLRHPAALYRNGTAEARVAWIMRLAKSLDKYSGERK